MTLLHPPYTLWHLAYVAIGAALAPELSTTRLLLALAAFFLALGIAAHALDELAGRPLGTAIPDTVLVALAVSSLAGALAIGGFATAAYTRWLAVFVAAGAFLLVAYNLELFGGRFHGDLWFALAWGAFPVLTAFFVTAETLTPSALLAALFAFALSSAQRRLSKQVRDVRRRVERVEGTIVRRDGSRTRLTATTLIEAEERALRALTASTVALAAALVIMRLT